MYIACGYSIAFKSHVSVILYVTNPFRKFCTLNPETLYFYLQPSRSGCHVCYINFLSRSRSSGVSTPMVPSLTVTTLIR